MPFQSSCARFGLSASAAFLPSSLSNLSLWLDAADTTSITLSGQNVTAWRDKSGLSNNASAVGTLAFTSNINGITTPKFPTVGNTYFGGTIVNTGSTLSAVAVYIINSADTNNSRIISLGTSGTQDWNNTSSVAAIVDIAPNPTFTAYRNSSALGKISSTYGVPAIGISIFTGSSNTFYLNGTAGTTVASTGNFNYSIYRIGTAVGSENLVGLTGTVGEVIIYNNALTTSQRQQVEGYLAWKWGLQTSLPTNHPYYNSRP